MCASDAASYWGETFIDFILILKAILGYHNLVHFALPFPHQARSSPESSPCAILCAGVQRGDNLLKFCLRLGFQAALGQLLDPESKDGKHKLTAKTRRCWSSKALLPEVQQASSVKGGQAFKEFCCWVQSLPQEKFESSDALPRAKSQVLSRDLDVPRGDRYHGIYRGSESRQRSDLLLYNEKVWVAFVYYREGMPKYQQGRFRP